MTVDSSFIKNINCNLGANQVMVTIEDKTYIYLNVPSEVMAMFLVAESKGHFFTKYIKPVYTFYSI